MISPNGRIALQSKYLVNLADQRLRFGACWSPDNEAISYALDDGTIEAGDFTHTVETSNFARGLD